MAPLHYTSKFYPILSLDCAPFLSLDQILPSVNTGGENGESLEAELFLSRSLIHNCILSFINLEPRPPAGLLMSNEVFSLLPVN